MTMIKGCHKYRFSVPTFARHTYYEEFGSFTFDIEVIVLDLDDPVALQEAICTASELAADGKDGTELPDDDSDDDDDTDSEDDP